MSEPRKHHIVAQTYQRGFARKKGRTYQVRALNKRTGEGGLRSVRDNFAERDLNTIAEADGTRNQDVEKFLAEQIDGPAAPVLGALREDRFPLDDERRSILSIFMSAQLVRGRWPRENIGGFIEETSRLTLKMAAAHYTDEKWIEVLGEVPSDATRQQFLNNERHFDIRPTNAMLLQTILAPVDEVAGYLSARTWTLVRFAKPCLLTAENPVVHITPRDDSSGYGVATAERMYMAVSPTRGLVLSHPWSSWPEAIVDGTEALAERLNPDPPIELRERV